MLDELEPDPPNIMVLPDGTVGCLIGGGDGGRIGTGIGTGVGGGGGGVGAIF